MTIKHLITIPADGTNDNSFVGLKIKDNQIEFHYPETYVLSTEDDELKNNILSILRSISLSEKSTKAYSSYNVDTNNEGTFPLGSYLWIINDYIKNGRYENKEKTFELNTKGKVNWKKTMKNNPIVSNGNVIYNDIVYERKNQIDNLLTEIYNFCVKKAIDDIGWLYNLHYDPNGVDYNKLFLSKQKLYISTIISEFTHTFDDNKKARLQHMKNIISGLDDNIIQTKELIYGVDKYDAVYEAMVDSMFSNINNIKEFYPNATWELLTEKEPKKSTNLRPDTILIKDKKVYILDAKYYRFGSTFLLSDAPTTDSIQKQITYGEYIKKVKDGEYDDIYSAFIMPYSRIHNPESYRFNRIMEFVGIATAKWYELDDLNNRKIVGILLDTNYLIDNWAKRNEDNLNDIINLIENSLKGRLIDE